MKKILLLAILVVSAVLYLGYYKELAEGSLETILFVKKYPTLQVRFYNIHANNGDYRRVEDLTAGQRKKIIDYCRYRLGVDTVLKTQADVVMCSKR
jgi:hypothetical protein